MTNDTKKTSKLKTAGLITLLAGALAVGGITYHQYSNPDEAQLKKEISQMSVAQLEFAIKECDTALARLRTVIDAKETNPEERFEARRAVKSISEERELYQKRLNQIKQQKK